MRRSLPSCVFFFFNDPPTPEIYPLPLHAALPISVPTSPNTTTAFPAGTLRPDLLHDPSLRSDQRTSSRWFDITAFVNPTPYTFGNSPRSGLRGDRKSTRLNSSH